MANPTRFTKQQDLANVGHHRQRFENLSSSDKTQERLNQLQAFVRQLASTDLGRKDLHQRANLLGPCRPAAGETPSVFYGRLRRWLDQDLLGRVRSLRGATVAGGEDEYLS
jgi:hypothetical protein